MTLLFRRQPENITRTDRSSGIRHVRALESFLGGGKFFEKRLPRRIG